jgi:hypothetical protein
MPRKVSPAAEPAAHDVKLTGEASLTQLAPEPGDVRAALLQPLIKVVCVGIDDAGASTPLRFGEGFGSEELAHGAVIEVQLPGNRNM